MATPDDAIKADLRRSPEDAANRTVGGADWSPDPIEGRSYFEHTLSITEPIARLKDLLVLYSLRCGTDAFHWIDCHAEFIPDEAGRHEVGMRLAGKFQGMEVWVDPAIPRDKYLVCAERLAARGEGRILPAIKPGLGGVAPVQSKASAAENAADGWKRVAQRLAGRLAVLHQDKPDAEGWISRAKGDPPMQYDGVSSPAHNLLNLR